MKTYVVGTHLKCLAKEFQINEGKNKVLCFLNQSPVKIIQGVKQDNEKIVSVHLVSNT